MSSKEKILYPVLTLLGLAAFVAFGSIMWTHNENVYDAKWDGWEEEQIAKYAWAKDQQYANRYTGSLKTKVYHRFGSLTCLLSTIEDSDAEYVADAIITFYSKEEAEKAGYTVCPKCFE